MANTYLTYTQQTPSTAEGQKFTWSAWVKKSKNGVIHGLWGNTYNNTHRAYLYFHSTDKFMFYDSAGTDVSTNAMYRDLNGWYHVVVTGDTTQSTSSDRVKIWINGELQTSLATTTYPSQDSTFKLMNTTNTPTLGKMTGSGGNIYYTDGYMSHVHFTQGYTYQASDFGETDSTTGEWKIKTSPSISNYGTNGFWWLKDSIATTDHSPNSNTFSVGGGTLTKSEDCPSNIFTTLNPLVPSGGGFQSNSSTFANGATKFTTNNSSSNFGLALSTLGMTTGKYYAEAKYTASGSNDVLLGIRGWQGTSTNNYLGDTSRDYALYIDGKMYQNNTETDIGGTSWTAGDYIGIFVDCDNWKIYFSKNGTIMNTTGYTIADITADTNVRSLGAYFFGCVTWDSGGNAIFEWNFGNGSFGSTQLTGTTYDGSDGNGIFKYNPKNITLDGSSKSFKALTTKGLNA